MNNHECKKVYNYDRPPKLFLLLLVFLAIPVLLIYGITELFRCLSRPGVVNVISWVITIAFGIFLGTVIAIAIISMI